MTIDLKQMTLDLKHEDPPVRIYPNSDTQLLAAKVITRDFLRSRTALALGAGWLGLIVGLLIGR